MSVTINGVDYQDLAVDVAGKQIAFRACESSNNNAYWAVAKVNKNGERKSSKYGVRIAPLAAQLPKKVSIIDPANPKAKATVVTLEAGTTEDGRAKVSYRGKRSLPNGEERMVSVSFSVTKDGNWNAKVAAVGTGGFSAPEPVALDLL